MDVIIFLFYFLVKEVSSAIVCEESHNGNGLLDFLGLDNLSAQVFGFVIISLVCYNLLNHGRNPSGREEIMPEFKKSEPRAPDAGLEKRDVDSEYPNWIALGHVVFNRTGVEILATDFETDGQVKVLRDLYLQAQSPSEILEEDELLLSPEIKLTASNSRFSGRLEVRIPHGANMILSCPKWNVFLKELRNNKWKATNQTEENGIRKFVSESNHVRFLTEHLSTYVIVGKYDRSSPSMFKRMKIAAFCSETEGGEDIRIRIHFFDDCEWSYERLTRKEQVKEGKLVSSIESLNFSVTCEEDVATIVKDVEGWQLDQTASDLSVSHELLKNSFNDFPQLELMFRSSGNSARTGFFGVLVFTQPSIGETVLYVRVPVKKMFVERMKKRWVNQCETGKRSKDDKGK
ncbi:uncharacterized protein [Montipora foliosa]|uniref:uncharacterized protein n=1 Tax=Montipora foliosa TaxID=591990 RepID=UPI0035F1A791